MNKILVKDFSTAKQQLMNTINLDGCSMVAQFTRFDFDARMHDHHVTEKQQQRKKQRVRKAIKISKKI
jgi:hypothetical protein